MQQPRWTVRLCWYRNESTCKGTHYSKGKRMRRRNGNGNGNTSTNTSSSWQYVIVLLNDPIIRLDWMTMFAVAVVAFHFNASITCIRHKSINFCWTALLLFWSVGFINFDVWFCSYVNPLHKPIYELKNDKLYKTWMEFDQHCCFTILSFFLFNGSTALCNDSSRENMVFNTNDAHWWMRIATGKRSIRIGLTFRCCGCKLNVNNNKHCGSVTLAKRVYFLLYEHGKMYEHTRTILQISKSNRKNCNFLIGFSSGMPRNATN